MKYEWIADYLITKNGATRDFKVEWQWDRFQIGMIDQSYKLVFSSLSKHSHFKN